MKCHGECNEKKGGRKRHSSTSRHELELLIAHIVSTLPDSLARRERLLIALAAEVPPSHPCRPLLRELQAYLQEHQQLQERWRRQSESLFSGREVK
jgi:hypothetical protein